MKSKVNEFDNIKENKLTFVFDNKEAALHFKNWLCGSGEQQYWEWMEYREEEEEKGNITAMEFDYHTSGSNIRCVCGRLDKEE